MEIDLCRDRQGCSEPHLSSLDATTIALPDLRCELGRAALRGDWLILDSMKAERDPVPGTDFHSCCPELPCRPTHLSISFPISISVPCCL